MPVGNEDRRETRPALAGELHERVDVRGVVELGVAHSAGSAAIRRLSRAKMS